MLGTATRIIAQDLIYKGVLQILEFDIIVSVRVIVGTVMWRGHLVQLDGLHLVGLCVPGIGRIMPVQVDVLSIKLGLHG